MGDLARFFRGKLGEVFVGNLVRFSWGTWRPSPPHPEGVVGDLKRCVSNISNFERSEKYIEFERGENISRIPIGIHIDRAMLANLTPCHSERRAYSPKSNFFASSS